MARRVGRLGFGFLLAVIAAAPFCRAADPGYSPGLKPGDLVSVCGDSITEQKLYSNFIEDYLLMCKPTPDVRAQQLGWGGETSWGFLQKMPVFALPFKGTVATTCYGMNDGGYGPLNDERAQKYRDAQTQIVQTFKKNGVHFIVVGSSGVVDSVKFRPNQQGLAEVYNKTLASLRDIAKDVAQKEGVGFADVNAVMADAMPKLKAKYGNDYDVAGPDGVHPNLNGHLMMAYAFLKALGVSGDVGTVTVDLNAHKADASDGHKVLSVNGGSIEIESSKYPFCFWGDPARSDATTGVIEFVPFNQDLNRLKLIVTDPGVDRLRVTWGKNSKDFSAADLAKGINLAAEFLDNPFSEPFKAVHDQIHHKQELETTLIKNMYFNVSGYKDQLPEARAQFDQVTAMIEQKIAAATKEAPTWVKPVKHVIKIEPIK